MNVGNRVQWTVMGGTSKQISMRVKSGVIASLDNPDRPDEDMATVRTDSGAEYVVAVARLRTPEQKTQLTEFIDAFRDAAHGNK